MDAKFISLIDTSAKAEIIATDNGHLNFSLIRLKVLFLNDFCRVDFSYSPADNNLNSAIMLQLHLFEQ